MRISLVISTLDYGQFLYGRPFNKPVFWEEMSEGKHGGFKFYWALDHE
jgi:hypothetical protein